MVSPRVLRVARCLPSCTRHLERARIVFAIENEMSTEERNLTTNKYWTNVDGERYLQVEEVDDKCFLCEDDEGEDAADEAVKNKDDDHTKKNGEKEIHSTDL